MADAYVSYTFGLLEPGETAGVYLHGFSPNEVTVFEVHAVASPSFPTAFHPSVDVDATNTGQHVDQTIYHTIYVTNVSTSNGAAPKPVVSIYALSQAVS